jgi:hypothetical protein
VGVLLADRMAGLQTRAETLLQNAERGLDPGRVALYPLKVRQSHLNSSMPDLLRFRRAFI